MQKLLFVVALLFNSQVQAQINVQFKIDRKAPSKPISPYIFGVNAAIGIKDADDEDENVGARRQGGNRLSSYNWEINASNAGADYLFNSDNWLNNITGVPDEKEEEPASLITHMHDQSLKMNTYSLITVPMAGFVAADKDGPVKEDEIAPSPRWKTTKAFKGIKLSLKPNVSDDAVYADEMVNFLVNKYGRAETAKGIKGYSLDNEPALWAGTHKRMHPAKPTCTEMFAKSIQFAAAIKSIDPTAQVFGGALYGYGEHINFQGAKDWSHYKNGYKSYTEAFLDKMKHASDSISMRLIDVLDFHWYPEARGLNEEGKTERINEGGNSPGVAFARMQAPRTLWDSTYNEKSWIAESFGKVTLIPSLQKSIDKYYPGTKIAFGEFDYGGINHISGGIAMADVFGIFARHDVYLACLWNATNDYASASYRIFRNYDNKKSTWGDSYVLSNTSDIENTSVYSAFANADTSELHIIVINKSMDQPVKGFFTIESEQLYKNGKVFQFNKNTIHIKEIMPVDNLSNNSFTYELAPLSVSHLVLKSK